MADANSLLTAIGNYACEQHFPETLNALMEESFYYVDEKPRLFFELKAHALNFKVENTTKIVRLMEKIKSIYLAIFSGDVNTLLYCAKALEVFSILKSTDTSNFDGMTLLHFRNTVDCNFPEEYVSASEENVKLYAVMRKIFIKISMNLSTLKQFCENELEKRWKKFEDNFREQALSLVNRGFKYLEECNNSEVEGLKIHEHLWWKEFQQHYLTQNDCDETYKTFVDFIKDKHSRRRR